MNRQYLQREHNIATFRLFPEQYRPRIIYTNMKTLTIFIVGVADDQGPYIRCETFYRSSRYWPLTATTSKAQ